MKSLESAAGWGFAELVWGKKIKLAATNGSERDSPPDKVDLLVTSLTVIMPPFAITVNLNRHVFTNRETLIDLDNMIYGP